MTVSGDRPQYLAETLESWSMVRGLADWPFIFAVEPGPHAPECVDLIERHLDGLQVSVVLNERRLGVLGNPHFVLGRGFEVARYVVLAEEDVLVSNDVLDYLAWGDRTFETDGSALGVCAASKSLLLDGHLSAVRQVCDFSPLVWATWRDRWEGILRDTWDLDYSSGPTREESGWDWNIGRLLQARDMYCVFPDVSRSLHIGVYGVHVRPEFFEASQEPSFAPHHSMDHWSEP